MELGEPRIYHSNTIAVELSPKATLEASAIADNSGSRECINEMEIWGILIPSIYESLAKFRHGRQIVDDSVKVAQKLSLREVEPTLSYCR